MIENIKQANEYFEAAEGTPMEKLARLYIASPALRRIQRAARKYETFAPIKRV
jgi:hypothetical protein